MESVEKTLQKQPLKGSRKLRNAALVSGGLLVLYGSLAAWGIAPLPRKHPKDGVVRNYAVVWPGKVMRSGSRIRKTGGRGCTSRE
jgi:hypothetical protein